MLSRRLTREDLGNLIAHFGEASSDNREFNNLAALRRTREELLDGIIQTVEERDRAIKLLEHVKGTCHKCHGRGIFTLPCTLCGDSTYEHVCNDKEVFCDACTEVRDFFKKGT